MPAETYILNFDGYWRRPNISGLPAQSGIYCVYTCTHDAERREVTLSRIIYIGESGDIKSRVRGHELWSQWEKQLNLGEVLCFSAALISPGGARKRAEAAMIYHHKPPCNTEYIDSFPFDQTAVTTKGQNSLLGGSFTVFRRVPRRPYY